MSNFFITEIAYFFAQQLFKNNKRFPYIFKGKSFSYQY